MITYVIESHAADGSPLKMHQSDLLAICERAFRGTALDINLRWESFDGVDELIDKGLWMKDKWVPVGDVDFVEKIYKKLTGKDCLTSPIIIPDKLNTQGFTGRTVKFIDCRETAFNFIENHKRMLVYDPNSWKMRKAKIYKPIDSDRIPLVALMDYSFVPFTDGSVEIINKNRLAMKMIGSTASSLFWFGDPGSWWRVFVFDGKIADCRRVHGDCMLFPVYEKIRALVDKAMPLVESGELPPAYFMDIAVGWPSTYDKTCLFRLSPLTALDTLGMTDHRFPLALHSTWQWMLSKAEEPKREPDYNDLLKFSEEYCRNCGTQRCMGVFDEEWREGCTEYKRKFK